MKFLAVLSVVVVGVFAQHSSGPIFFARYSAAPQPQFAPQARLVPYSVGTGRYQAQLVANKQVPQTADHPSQPASPSEVSKNNTDDATETTDILKTNPAVVKNQGNQNEKLQQANEAEPAAQNGFYLQNSAQRLSQPIFFAKYSVAPQPQAGFVPYTVGIGHSQAQVLGNPQVPQTAYYPASPTPVASATPPTEVSRNATNDAEETTEGQAEKINPNVDFKRKAQENQSGKLQQGAASEPEEQGAYYLYHPNGVLQKVAYETSNDAVNMAYIAQLRYQNVAPVTGPIYTYDPQNYELQQLRLY